MNIRVPLFLSLLACALALSACGNKGPLLPPPAPDDEDWPAQPVDQADADADADAERQEIESGVDGEGDDPPADGGDDGDGDA